ncbi:MAG: ATP-binding cassette domain-containing protein [Cyclobacteriaceae bacterium]
MLTCKNLNYTYDDGPTLNFPDWEVTKGNHALILGPSGCGKTSLLHLLSGLIRPPRNSVLINAIDLGTLSPAGLDNFRGKNIGFVFQKPHLIASLSIRENVKLSAMLAKLKVSNDEIDQLLDHLGIQELAKKKAYQISQGQAQRVAIARAVIHKPALIIGDEPTASLDDVSCQKVIELLKSEAEHSGSTLLIATHDHRVKDHFSNQLEL